MLGNFTYHNPTRLHFGPESLNQLAGELANYGPRVQLIYGGGSIKKSGLYEQVIAILKEAGKEIFEDPGVMPNPTVEKLYEGCRIAKENNVDLLLAVGGGSCCDYAKGVAVSAWCDEDPWKKYYLRMEEPDNRILPVGCVLTMVGTGSEMDGDSVVTNEETKVKTSCWDYSLYPRFAVLNPEFTYSVPEYQMVSGIFDILSHTMEIYFSPEDEDNLSDDLAEAIMGSVIRSTAAALKNPRDYTARSNLMWASSLALSGLLSPSKREDWEVHQIQHQIGAYYDCAHGMGLAAVSPAYYRLVCPYALPRFKRFAVNVWGIDPAGKSDLELAHAGIDALAAFIRDSRMTANLRQLGLPDDSLLETIAATCNLRKGGYHPLTRQEVLRVLRESF